MNARVIRQTLPPVDEERVAAAQQRLEAAWGGAAQVTAEVRRLTALLDTVDEVEMEPLDEADAMVATAQAGLVCVSDAGMRRGA